MRLLPVLLLVLACSGERAPRPSGIDTTTPSLPTEAPRFATAASRADTLACLYTSAGGKTACVTVAPRIDTVRIPVAPTVVTGLPFVNYECNSAANMAPWTGCMRSAGYWSAGEMAAVKSAGGKYLLNQGGYDKFRKCSIGVRADSVAQACKRPGADSTYAPAQYYAWVQTLKPYADSWKSFIADGTLMGAQVTDDIGKGNWGQVAITKGQQDTMALWWKQLVPGITTWTREKATGLTGYPFTYLDGSITSYNGRYMGDPLKWRDSNLVAAKSAKLALAFGFNVLNGGKLVLGCYHGEESQYCAMTATEILSFASVILAVPEMCAVVSWKLNPAYQSQPGITEALKSVGSIASLRSAPPCRRPT